VAGLTLAHSVPTGFVLPVVIAAAQGEVLLGPDDLSARLQLAGGQTGSDDISVQSPVPNIRDIPGEQRIHLTPVGAIVVEHLAPREFVGTEALARSPRRLIPDPIRRIGNHQVRLRSRQHGFDIRRAGAVVATNPVVPQLPYITELSDWLIEYFRHAVGIRQTARSQTGQDGFELIRVEADQVEVETGGFEVPELVAELAGFGVATPGAWPLAPRRCSGRCDTVPRAAAPHSLEFAYVVAQAVKAHQ
jgi:hypothetical protein